LQLLLAALLGTLMAGTENSVILGTPAKYSCQVEALSGWLGRDKQCSCCFAAPAKYVSGCLAATALALTPLLALLVLQLLCKQKATWRKQLQLHLHSFAHLQQQHVWMAVLCYQQNGIYCAPNPLCIVSAGSSKDLQC
jgi:hypothetical protein